jgi:hypothetical protein
MAMMAISGVVPDTAAGTRFGNDVVSGEGSVALVANRRAVDGGLKTRSR